MKVAIIGYSVEGKSALSYWQKQGHEITVCDLDPKTEVPAGIATQVGSDYLKNLSGFDLIVRSPGVRPSLILEANPGLDSTKITSVTNEFMDHCSVPIIGVTGTKGKGTASTLIARMLEAAGKTVHLGGNIGKPALDLLPDVKPEDYVVLELSSFQLFDVRRSPHIAVILMVTEDHLDWHTDVGEYADAKGGIVAHQSADDVVIYNADNETSTKLAKQSKGGQIPFSTVTEANPGSYLKDDAIWVDDIQICKVADVALSGRHNLQNVCAAAAAVWQIVQDPEPLAEAIKGFKGLEHRLEPVAEVNGITYVNDSISTTPDTAIAAAQAYAQPKVMILGGSDKGASFDQLAQAVKNANVRSVILIGKMTPKLKQAFDDAGYPDVLLGTGSMEEVVQLAADTAQPGDIVLLSPACASFDMFKDYKDRGDQFKRAVLALA